MSLSTDVAFELGQGMVLEKQDTTIAIDFECLVQEIKIESITAQGDLWYDTDYGWGLQDFIHPAVDEMLKLEIYQRVKLKMSKRDEVVKESIKIIIEEKNDAVCIHVRFTAYGQEVAFDLTLDRVKVEVRFGG